MASQPQVVSEGVRIPQPRPDGELPAITGSVPAKAAPPAPTAVPAKSDREAATGAPPHEMARATAPTPSAITVAALDLGGYRSLAALKQAWGDMSGRHAEFGSGVEPLARLHETDTGIEARLVVGPYPNQTEAAKGCVRLRTLGVACSVTGYGGQPLAALR